MYQRQGKVAYKANLDNTKALATYLDHPENGFKSVHVAGTNGKGSTSHILASIVQEAGYTVGLYTSPHLKDFRERIKINGNMIPKRSVSSFVSKHKGFFEERKLSFFEMTVGLAFDYFRREKVDIAIIEVGLGGRLDSTNIITPEVSVITNIGLDHTQFLGTTLTAIALEKGGIIKAGIPVVIGERVADTEVVFKKISATKNAPIYFAEDRVIQEYPSDLKGNYQQNNQRTALRAIEILQQKGWKISEQHIANGLLNVVGNTGLKGRWQLLGEKPRMICDTAHNREGLHYVMKHLGEETFEQLHIVMGVVSDKDLATILPLFPEDAVYYFCSPNIARALPANTLQQVATAYRLHGNCFASVKDAVKQAKKKASIKDLIFIGGSTFVVAEVV